MGVSTQSFPPLAVDMSSSFGNLLYSFTTIGVHKFEIFIPHAYYQSVHNPDVKYRLHQLQQNHLLALSCHTPVSPDTAHRRRPARPWIRDLRRKPPRRPFLFSTSVLRTDATLQTRQPKWPPSLSMDMNSRKLAYCIPYPCDCDSNTSYLHTKDSTGEYYIYSTTIHGRSVKQHRQYLQHSFWIYHLGKLRHIYTRCWWNLVHSSCSTFPAFVRSDWTKPMLLR